MATYFIHYSLFFPRVILRGRSVTSLAVVNLSKFLHATSLIQQSGSKVYCRASARFPTPEVLIPYPSAWGICMTTVWGYAI